MHLKSKLPYLCFLLVLHAPVTIGAVTEVNCPDESLARAIDAALPGDSLVVSGICEEAIRITTDNVSIKGENATISAPHAGDSAVTIDGAVRGSISNLAIQGGLAGVSGKSNASFTLKEITITGGTLGVDLDSGAHAILEDVQVENVRTFGISLAQGAKAEIVGIVSATGASRGFGINAQNNSAVRIEPGAELQLSENFVGGQFVVGSTIFLEGGLIDNNLVPARLIANNNAQIGFSINTGGSAILFNAELEASGNGLDGLDAVSAANLDVDGTSTVTANGNGRDGISIDNGTFNTFGFFFAGTRGPVITANNNGGNGVLVENAAYLDIGVNSTITAKSNGAAGVAVDNGSTALLRGSEIRSNNGMLKTSGDDDDNGKRRRKIDFLATFGSRVTFVSDNDIGKAICDRSSISRGDVKCRRAND